MSIKVTIICYEGKGPFNNGDIIADTLTLWSQHVIIVIVRYVCAYVKMIIDHLSGIDW